jgi:hypothetical protein
MNEKLALPSVPTQANPTAPPPSYHWASLSPVVLKNEEEQRFSQVNDKFEKYITDRIRAAGGEVIYPIDEMHEVTGSNIFNERILKDTIANAQAQGFHARLTQVTETGFSNNETHKYIVNVLQISKSPFLN